MSDLKKGRPQSTPLEPGSAFTDNRSNSSSKLNVRAPAYQRFHRSALDDDDNGDEKVCRICLEEDSPETMIAPCLCKGGSKWVHRECLDEWRTNEKDRAFSKCTECLFEYHLQPVDNESETDEEHGKSGCCRPCTKPQRRRCLFYYMVSRDACLGVVLQQLIIVFLGAVAWLLLQESDISSSLPPMTPGTMVLVSYGFGWFAFFIALGIYGCVVMCRNGCDIKKSIPNLGPPSEMDAVEATSATPISGAPNPTGNNDSYQTHNYSRYQSDGGDDGYYTRQDHHREHYRQRSSCSSSTYDSYQTYNYSRYQNDGGDDGYCTRQGHHREHYRQRSSCSSSTYYYRRARRRHYYYGPTYYPMYYPMYVDTGNDASCFCCCCPTAGSGGGTGGIRALSGGGGGIFSGGGRSSSSSSSSSSSNSSGSDSGHILLMILLVVAIILATIGFCVGVVVTMVVIQRIIGRHIYLLQKRQLVKEFQVTDLQDYDLDKPTPAKGDDTIDDAQKSFGDSNLGTVPNTAGTGNPPPSAPVVPSEDIAYLKNLGLMED